VKVRPVNGCPLIVALLVEPLLVSVIVGAIAHPVPFTRKCDDPLIMMV
jgi:hypothetical protein